MRVALGQVPALTDDYIAYALQLGVPSIHLNTPALPGTHRWEVADLLALAATGGGRRAPPRGDRERPNSFYMDVMLGRPGRDEQIEHFQATIRNLERLGSRSWATTSSRHRSGGHRRARTAEAAPSSPDTTMRSRSIPNGRATFSSRAGRRRRTTRSSGARSMRPTACSTTTRCGPTTSTSSRP